jgi:hypothetical protein
LNVQSGYARSDHWILENSDQEMRCVDRPACYSRTLSGQTVRSAPKGCPQSRNVKICQNVFSLRKEVIQPQVLLRLPCYDFTPIMNDTLDGCSLAVSSPASSATHFRDVTGGVYKARERIHRGMLIRDY